MEKLAKHDCSHHHRCLITSTFAAVCISCVPTHSFSAPPLQQRYDESVEAARKGDLPSKMLIPVPTNHPSVRLVTWMPGQSALVEPQGSASGPPHKVVRDIWVSLQSEIQSRCKRFTVEERKDMPLRIRQLLGLPPEFGGKHPGGFQVIEISTMIDGRVFRPCTDPDPHTTVCPSPIAPGPNMEISSDHRAWIQQTHQASFARNRFPWTQVGYTFDWAVNEEFYGVSEYILPKSTPVRLLEWIPLDRFCGAS